MKILNLYAGIGGNRKLWGSMHQVTAVELDPDIAKIYKDLYPDNIQIINKINELIENWNNNLKRNK